MMEPHSWQAGASAWFSKACLCSSEMAERETTSCWVTGMGPVEELSRNTMPMACLAFVRRRSLRERRPRESRRGLGAVGKSRDREILRHPFEREGSGSIPDLTYHPVLPQELFRARLEDLGDRDLETWEEG